MPQQPQCNVVYGQTLLLCGTGWLRHAIILDESLAPIHTQAKMYQIEIHVQNWSQYYPSDKPGMLTRPQSARPRPRPRPQTYDQGQAKAKATEVKAKAKAKAKAKTIAVTVKTNQFNCRPNDSGFF